jgi:hypothetical protein
LVGLFWIDSPPLLPVKTPQLPNKDKIILKMNALILLMAVVPNPLATHFKAGTGQG